MSTWRELTFPINSLKDAVLVIEDDRANVLADPLRWRILEILGAGKSVTEISQTLDVTDARVLYHLQRLAQTGVVHLEEEGADPQEWRCLPAAGKVRVRDTRAAQDQIEEAMPTDVVSQFNQAFREAAEGLYGSTFQQSINHNRCTTIGRTGSRIWSSIIGTYRRVLSSGERGSLGHQIRFLRDSHAD